MAKSTENTGIFTAGGSVLALTVLWGDAVFFFLGYKLDQTFNTSPW